MVNSNWEQAAKDARERSAEAVPASGEHVAIGSPLLQMSPGTPRASRGMEF